MRPPWMDMTEFLEGINLHDAVMVEIGCYQGESTESFAKSGKFLRIFAVDPWVNNYNPRDPAALMSDMADVEAAFDARASHYPIIEKIKMYSADAAQLFKEQSLDLVYIDGNHDYKYVKQDIELCSRKIRSGGFLTGHDYKNPHVMWTGPKRAVDERFGKPDRVYFDSSWLVRIS